MAPNTIKEYFTQIWLGLNDNSPSRASQLSMLNKIDKHEHDRVGHDATVCLRSLVVTMYNGSRLKEYIQYIIISPQGPSGTSFDPADG